MKGAREGSVIVLFCTQPGCRPRADLLGLRFFCDFGLLDRARGSEEAGQSLFLKVQVMRYNGRRHQDELTGAIQIMMRREAFETSGSLQGIGRENDPGIYRAGSKTLGLMEVFGPLEQSFLDKPTSPFARLPVCPAPRIGLAITTSHEPRLTFLRRRRSTRRTRQRPEWPAEYRAPQQPGSS
jgi:hypothetical protein